MPLTPPLKERPQSMHIRSTLKTFKTYANRPAVAYLIQWPKRCLMDRHYLPWGALFSMVPAMPLLSKRHMLSARPRLKSILPQRLSRTILKMRVFFIRRSRQLKRMSQLFQLLMDTRVGDLRNGTWHLKPLPKHGPSDWLVSVGKHRLKLVDNSTSTKQNSPKMITLELITRSGRKGER